MAKLKFDPTKTLDFVDPRETPTYTVPEAAHYSDAGSHMHSG